MLQTSAWRGRGSAKDSGRLTSGVIRHQQLNNLSLRSGRGKGTPWLQPTRMYIHTHTMVRIGRQVEHEAIHRDWLNEYARTDQRTSAYEQTNEWRTNDEQRLVSRLYCCRYVVFVVRHYNQLPIQSWFNQGISIQTRIISKWFTKKQYKTNDLYFSD